MDHEEISWTDARDLLRQWREENVRKSRDIVHLWEHVLVHKEHKLGDERFIILEQVCIAAADVNRIDLIDQCLISLHNEFPGSLRVKRLQVLKLELSEKYDEALKFLDELCKIDETNPAPRKKRVAIFKSKGNIHEAIRELTEYLKKFMSDEEAWQELSELYLLEQDYAKAAFCIEEVILINPHNHLYHQRFADIKYTQGGYDNLEIARSHYCLAIKLSPNNIRALYGLFLCAANIAVNQKTQSQKKKESSKLAAWALKQLQGKYSEMSSLKNCVSSLEGLMTNLQITSP
ncbi:conserved hypothetical protein [Pediculus humanus corporis]|uniref:ER membrane protein complex subunit 2 n=1 Tax=Pediculus humanus subsp. corporis TaxID=121224 RepID=E0VW22_PEDHC|nr:uncharacterized protein Phum_PHUM473020 [Pediculus humanus corporis]EEB17578.1 conserved hypothetical protein [Pediculus humanus corporis]